MSETPLSDLIAQVAAGTPESFPRFLEAFRGSKLGVVAVGVPPGTGGEFVSTAEQPVSVGLTQHANGRSMALAFADPVVFAKKFGYQFNAEIPGEALLATVLLNPKCDGVLVNSALSEISIAIDRPTAELLVARSSGHREPDRRPWWRFW